MRTSKPLSTISYNTDGFLNIRLNEFMQNHIISEWYYIRHLPEDDEGGGKEHIHLYVEPSKMIQTDSLRESFAEFDPNMPLKPLTCPCWRQSKFADWYMYAIHNVDYLNSKGMMKKYHYKIDDVIAWDDDAKIQRVREIDLSSLTRLQAMLDAIEHGISFTEFCKSGGVPIQQVRQYKEMWSILGGFDLEILSKKY